VATLYEINAELENAINQMFLDVDQETGEVSDEWVQRIEDLQMQKDEKLDNIGAIIKNKMADVKALKDEESALKARREVKEREIENLKNYVSGILNGEKFESARVVFGFRKSDKIIVDNEEMIPKEFMKQKIEYSPDKVNIKKAIMDGVQVAGCHIETENNLQIK